MSVEEEGPARGVLPLRGVRWAALLVIVSQPLHFVAAVIIGLPALDLAAWVLNTVGFAAAGIAIWRLRDDDWELAPV